MSDSKSPIKKKAKHEVKREDSVKKKKEFCKVQRDKMRKQQKDDFAKHAGKVGDIVVMTIDK